MTLVQKDALGTNCIIACFSGFSYFYQVLRKLLMFHWFILYLYQRVLWKRNLEN